MGKEPRAKRATRAKKDPNMPKRAMSAYMFFAIENRESIKESHPDASFGEIGKFLGQAWRELAEPLRQPYINKADADKARYAREMDAYRAN